MTRLTFFLTIGLIAFPIAFPTAAMSQENVWELQNSGVATSLRGLCAVSETCCWASGAKGTVIRTTDGGTSWTVVYEHPEPVAFFDGMSFDPTGKHGWMMGDPINGKVHLLVTDDAGKTWRQLPAANSPSVADGVAAFAASGTHLLCPAKETLLIGLGGADIESSAVPKAAVLMTTNSGSEWQHVTVPIRAGQSAGIFSITALAPESPRLIVVGGESWIRISSLGFHIMSFVSPTIGWAAGSDGRVARWRSAR